MRTFISLGRIAQNRLAAPLIRLSIRRATLWLALYTLLGALTMFYVGSGHFDHQQRRNGLGIAADYAQTLAAIREGQGEASLGFGLHAGLAPMGSTEESGTHRGGSFIGMDLRDQSWTGIAFRLISQDPFPWRRSRTLDTFQSSALAALTANPDKPFYAFGKENGVPELRYATAVRMAQSCVQCHNSRPDSPRRDWAIGDIAGIQEIVLPKPPAIQWGQSEIPGLVLAFLLWAGGSIFLILVSRDIEQSRASSRLLVEVTERKNKELLASKQEAERASRAKSEFLANMSHELRTPLNAILGFSEIFKSELFGKLGAPKYREYATDIHTSGLHLLGIINDMLDMATIEVGKTKLDEARVRLSDIVHESARLLRERIVEASLDLKIDLSFECDRIWGDRRVLKQILINLISNAVKFTPPNGRIVITSGRRPDGCLGVQVSDTGIGIAAEDLPRIVQPFIQAESSPSRRYEGTGLGLPIAIGFAELHGGTLSIDSEPGRGTTVTLILPAERILIPPFHSTQAAS